MNRKYMMLGCTMILAMAAFASSNLSRNDASPQEQPPPQPQSNQVPEHVVYRHFFHHIVVLQEQAEEIRRQGDDGSSLRSYYRREASLNEDQERILNEIALECEREVEEQDARAQVIIDAFRARYPGGGVPLGETLPPPSPELREMQAERNAIILRARDRLRTAFGEQDFNRFEEFVQNRVTPNILPVSPSQ